MNDATLAWPVEKVGQLLQDAIATGESLKELPRESQSDAQVLRSRYLDWEKRTSMTLQRSFNSSGLFQLTPRSEFDGTSLALLDLKVGGTSLPIERIPEVIDDIEEKIRVLNSILDRLDLYEPTETSVEGANTTGEDPEGPIFLVHGHDHLLREQVRRFIENTTNRDVIVLDELPGKGRDVLGKLLDHAEPASFAVVLLTPDDTGGAKDQGTMTPRARQNVILELGLFLGMLGRSKVLAIYDSSVELPSDYHGVIYAPAKGSWQFDLAREMKAAGIPVSIDKFL